MLKPTISVVMPVLNGNLQHLSEAVDSILNQTFRDFEFIIIDDGSDDTTKQYLNQFTQQDKRIKLLTNEHNLGIATSLNKGIENALGTYIARHDADDIAEPTRLQVQLEYMLLNPQLSGCFTAVTHINMAGEAISQFPVSEQSSQLEAELFLNSRLCHPTMFMTKLALINVGLYPTTKYAQDYALYTRMIRQQHLFGGINIPLVRYRITDGGVTQSKRDIQLDIASNIAFEHVEHYLKPIDKAQFKAFWMFIAKRGETPISPNTLIKNYSLLCHIQKQPALNHVWLPEFKWVTRLALDKRKSLSLFVFLCILHIMHKKAG